VSSGEGCLALFLQDEMMAALDDLGMLEGLNAKKLGESCSAAL
jgi:hypothetical protein